jgi:hypothetical protein
MVVLPAYCRGKSGKANGFSWPFSIEADDSKPPSTVLAQPGSLTVPDRR